MPRNSTPPTPRLPAGQVRSPTLFFRNSAQAPVDLYAHIRYTGLALVSDSLTKPKAKRAAEQSFPGLPCRFCMGQSSPFSERRILDLLCHAFAEAHQKGGYLSPGGVPDGLEGVILKA